VVTFQNFISIDGAGFLDGNGLIQKIDTHGQTQYETEVLRCLASIGGNPVGGILLHGLKAVRGTHTVAIYRYYKQQPNNQNDINAFSAPQDRKAATPPGKDVRDMWGGRVLVPVLDAHGHAIQDPVTGIVATQPLKGTGGGSSVEIGFTPGMFSHQEAAGAAPDEVLAHELTHSYRQLRGNCTMTGVGCKIYKGPAGHAVAAWSENYPNLEEFFAVLVANIYISAKNAGERLRIEYFVKIANGQMKYGTAPDSGARNQQGALKQGNTASEAFVLEHYGRVTQLYQEETGLARAIAKVQCPFNPFRDYEAKLAPGSR
jgi:hypothetical protein